MSQYAQQLLPTCTEVNQHPGLSDYDHPKDSDIPAVKIDFDAKHKLSVNKWRLKCEFDVSKVWTVRYNIATLHGLQECCIARTACCKSWQAAGCMMSAPNKWWVTQQ